MYKSPNPERRRKNSKFKIIILVFLLCSANSFSQNWDINLLERINPQNPSSDLWRATSSSTYPIAIGLPIGLWIDGVAKKNKIAEKHAYEMAGSIILAGIGSQGMKIVFNRPRPYEKYNTVYPYKIANDNSFPSGHTSVAFAVATTVSIEYKKWYIVVPAYVWASGVGYSRMYLGEHYPTDVIAGAATGAASAIISHWLTKKILK